MGVFEDLGMVVAVNAVVQNSPPNIRIWSEEDPHAQFAGLRLLLGASKWWARLGSW